MHAVPDGDVPSVHPPRGVPRRRVIGVAAGAVLAAVLPSSATHAASAAGEFETLRLRWEDMLRGGPSFDPKDPDVARVIAGVDAHGRRHRQSMTTGAGRTRLWDDLPDAGDVKQTRLAYDRLRTMARAYRTRGSSQYNDLSFRDQIVDALEWMHVNRYNTTVEQRGNWWEWLIGCPLRLNDCCVLMYDDIPAARRADYTAAVRRFSPAPGPPTPGTTSTGANRVWKATVIAVHGLLTEDAARLATARDALSGVFPYVVSGDGFQRDGSFLQHEAHPYTGGYGRDLLLLTADLLHLLHGSTWRVTDPARSNVNDWVRDAYAPLMFRGAVSATVRGREISRSFTGDHTAGHGVVSAVLRLSQTAPAADARWFERLAKHWITTDTARRYLDHDETDTYPTPVDLAVRAKSLLTDSGVAPAAPPVASKVFAGMDRAVHQRPRWSMAIAMHSSRIHTYESVNGENLRGWHTADGATYLSVADDLGHFDGGYWPTVDPYRLPGTTVDTGRLADGAGQSWSGRADWAGGATLGAYGAVGMHLDAYGSSLEARKSWFCLDEEVVALAAGVTATDGRRVETVLENRRSAPSQPRTLTVDGTVRPPTAGWSQEMAGVSWMHLSGVGGYWLPGGSTVHASRANRTAAWRDVNEAGASSAVTNQHVALWIDHGADPANRSCAYVLLPGMTAAQTAAYADRPGVQVLANTGRVQAIRHSGLGLTAANFWADGETTTGEVTCDRKASVLVQRTGDRLQVAVSSPMHGATAPVTLRTTHSAADVVSADDGVQVVSLDPLTVRVAVAGARGRTFRAVVGLA